MQTERTFVDDIKHQYKHGGMTMRLLFINSGIFILIQLLQVFGRLIGGLFELDLKIVLTHIFTLDTDLNSFILQPWGLITSIFAHFTFFHFIINMVFLYFAGRMFETLFNAKRLLYTYILGGIFGGLLEIIAHLIFPALQTESIVIVGASGSIMAIFGALAFYRPNLMVNLFGVFPIRLIFLAGFFILADLFSLGMDDGTAHFAHIGGVILGMISVQNVHSSNNLITRLQLIFGNLGNFLRNAFGSKKKMTYQQGGSQRSTRIKTDEEYNMEAKERQMKIDAILDKISKSGYESLTKAEKEFLFNQSKNG